VPNTQTATISTTTNGTTTTQWKTTTYDGFGRTVRVQTGNNGTAVTNVDTQYGACGCSPLGKAIATSMPYAPGSTIYWTTNTYDGSGRTLTQTKPDGSVTTTSYAGNSVTTTDPAGKWKTYYSDVAGGLTKVVEPDPNNATPSSNPVTYHTLNGAGQIVGVSVQRGGVAQNRTFVWSGQDLTSATDPETGTTTYQYDGNHHVTQRTEAKGQQTKYTYDAYERLIEVQHYVSGQEQTNQRVLYTYDVNPLDPGNYANSWGRLTGVSFQQQTFNNNQFAYYYSYNQAGRVTTNTFQAINGSTLLANLAATYAWDNQGRMTNMTYPSSPQLTYQYDTMGRLSQITSPNYPTSVQGYTAFVSATYTAANQLSSLQYGAGVNGGDYTETRSYNSLMQLTGLTNVAAFGAYNGTAVNMQYVYPAGHNNGRVSQTVDGILGETVNYTYDMWNRLTSAAATSGSWGEAYAFDNFGNLTGKTPTTGTAPSMSVAANLSTNPPTNQGGFDANGNSLGIMNAAYPNTWDVENRLVATQANTTQPTNYTYDPWGRRVWKEIPGVGTQPNGNPNPTTFEVYFYGVTGQKLETYSGAYTGVPGYIALEGINVYFGKKLLQSKGVWVATDRLGSRAGELERAGAVVLPVRRGAGESEHGEWGRDVCDLHARCGRAGLCAAAVLQFQLGRILEPGSRWD
jgi:YD repeat-containing protein